MRRAVHRHLGRAVGVPELARAKAHASSLLPHDQDGRLLPFPCPIECFTVFGAGVYAYMRWTVLMKRVFFIAFLFSVRRSSRGGTFPSFFWSFVVLNRLLRASGACSNIMLAEARRRDLNPNSFGVARM